MKIFQCYLETSIFGFYFDEDIINREKRESVRKLFQQIKNKLLVGSISDICINELMKTPEPFKTQFETLIKDFDLEILEYKEEEVSHLAQLYIAEGIIPERFENDAFHIAIATVKEVDILITLNCKHIANEFIIRKIKAINYKEGYTKELSIRTPIEVIFYED